jgi:CheY-like chemotaxis protein
LAGAAAGVIIGRGAARRKRMEDFAKLLNAVAALAWPVVAGVVLYRLYGPIAEIVRSATGRKFTIKVAGNELTMDEASEQQRVILADLQARLADLEKQVGNASIPKLEAAESSAAALEKQLLWVDDQPKNNSYLVATLEERGARVDVALTTEEGLAKLKRRHYDAVISDMGRPEGERAGIDLARQVKAARPTLPIYIYCGAWAAAHLRDEALAAGVTEITSSGTALMAALQAPSA